VDAPTVTACSNTPTFIWYNTSASSTTNNSSYNTSTKKLTLTSSNNNSTWYAITTAPKITHTATFYKNGASKQTNAAWTAVTDNTVTRTCERVATYNCTAQASTCTIKSPTITAASNFSVVWYATTSGATSSSWNQNTDKTDVSSDLTYYAITKRNAVTYKVNFEANWNTISATSGSCTIWAVYNW
jgi:hypothetical protein